MQKISLLHQFILQKRSILESRDQTGRTLFDDDLPKMFFPTFNLCEFVSPYKKPGCFTDLFWIYG